MTTPSTSIVRLNHPQQNQGHFVTQSMWTNNVPQNSQAQQQFTVQKTTQPTSVLQYTTVKNGSTMKHLHFSKLFIVFFFFRRTWNANAIISYSNQGYNSADCPADGCRSKQCN